MADVLNMMNQLMIMFDETSETGSVAEIEINEIMIAKNQRQLKRIEEGERYER